MYQFTTTTVINSNLDSNGTTAKYTGSSTKLDVTRVGSFKKANILGIYKRPYAAGVKEVATVTMASATAGDVIRLEIWLKLSQQTNSEYANTYLDFQKPIVVEALYDTSEIVTATALVAQLNSLKDRFGYTYITATNADGSSATITLTVKENNQRFKSIVISKEDASPNSLIQPEYTTLATGSVTTAGKTGFGDDEWMSRSIMLPTYENTRYFGTNKEERPVIGGNYTQYTIRYSVTKDDNDGIVGNGVSITTHVFYVLSSLVSAFETELDKLSVNYDIQVTIDDSTLANSATGQLSATNAIGTVVWSVTSGTSATVNSSTGVVTTHATTVGDTVLRGTDSVGNYAEVTVTVA